MIDYLAMHPRLQGIVGYLADVRAELTAVVDGAAPDRMVRAPEGRWSGAQIIQHLGKVEGSCAKLFEGLFAKALADGIPEDRATGSLLGSLDKYGATDRTKRIEAPDRVAPEATPDFAASWASLRAVRSRTLAAVATVDGRDLTKLSAPHPIFGPLDGYQWVLLVGKHEARHLLQLEELLNVGTE
jgi:hypothetical protein